MFKMDVFFFELINKHPFCRRSKNIMLPNAKHSRINTIFEMAGFVMTS